MTLNDLLRVDVNTPQNLGTVPNQFPEMEIPSTKIAIIGEAPGEDEVTYGRPFVGRSGWVLDKLLQSARIPRVGCFVGNVCQERPPGNKIEKFLWHGPEIQNGLAALQTDLQRFKPNLCLLLGGTPLRAALGAKEPGIGEYRGSLFRCSDVSSPMYGFKCLATYHPSAIIKNYEFKPYVRFDLERAREEGGSSVLNLPKRTLRVFITPEECCQRLDAILDGSTIALDIEGGIQQGMTCVSFAIHPSDVFICHFGKMAASEEAKVLRSIARVLENPRVGKILQNALYDTFVFAWLHGILIRNIVHDTMLSGWEIYPEIRKALEVQTSIWTREPFYKNDIESKDFEKFSEYCCRDSAVTYEIALRHMEVFKRRPSAKAHFDFNMRMLEPLLFIEFKGIRYDKELAAKRHAQEVLELAQIESRMRSRLGYDLNPNSPQKTCAALYDQLKFPVQHPKEGNAYDKTKRTSDQGALLKLAKLTRDPFCFDILTWRHHDGRKSALELLPDADSRTRGTYNPVGSVTGRVIASKSPTGRGMALQTVTNDLKDLFLPDEGYYMFSCDLAGADGWTVAAECKALNDPTMLDDYQFGLKPAKILALLYKHGPGVNRWTRQQLKEASKDVSEKGPEGWLYFACKRVQHGTNYLLKPPTMSQQILEDSYKKMGKPIYVPIEECDRLQKLYLSRYYGVPYWQNKVKQEVVSTGNLVSSSGHERRFFGRPDDDTWRKAVAQNPQHHTTYVLNQAILQLWDDKENWNGEKDRRLIEPLHQVHDALVGQFPIPLTEWACPKIKSYFNNPITIAGVTLTIPYDGGYGPNWKDCKNPL
jgi:uracil-DNA glycosylase family 4